MIIKSCVRVPRALCAGMYLYREQNRQLYFNTAVTGVAGGGERQDLAYIPATWLHISYRISTSNYGNVRYRLGRYPRTETKQ